MQNRSANDNLKTVLEFGLGSGYIELTLLERERPQVVANKLITTLLTESMLHPWDAPHCCDIREHIAMLDLPDLPRGNRDEYEVYLRKQESDSRTYYGSYLSDDSDSDEEAEYQNTIKQHKSVADRRQRELRGRVITRHRARAQLGEIIYKNKTGEHKAGSLKVAKDGASSLFTRKITREIHFGELVGTHDVDATLTELNQLITNGVSLQSAIDTLKKQAEAKGKKWTDFYIAQYRGVCHVKSKWNQSSRRAHRADTNEINEGQYSASVYQAQGLNLFSHYAQAKQRQREDKARFEEEAETLKQILLTMREPKPYRYGTYSYRNLAYVLQNIYTEDYSGFIRLLSADPRLQSILLNDAIPFVSMGDHPYHAAKYAYGLKAYKGREAEILEPHWQADGRAERPYSGVIYTSLHPITDFDSNGPLHLISLNRAAEIHLRDEVLIIAEHESCHPAYLPEGRVIHKHIAKYPSFKPNYKEIMQGKYGLTKGEYDAFRAALLEGPRPHTKQYDYYKSLLGEAMCSYQEVRLIDIARAEAEARGGVLIYRDVRGTFSRHFPEDSINQPRSPIPGHEQDKVRAKQRKRANLANRRALIDEIRDPAERRCFSASNDASIDVPDPKSLLAEGVVLSLQASLMFNAIRNKHYLALKHYLAIPDFKAALNERFHTHELQEATLLHFAVGLGDRAAVGLLLEIDRAGLGCEARLVGEGAALTPSAYARHCNQLDILDDLQVHELLAEVAGVSLTKGPSL